MDPGTIVTLHRATYCRKLLRDYKTELYLCEQCKFCVIRGSWIFWRNSCKMCAEKAAENEAKSKDIIGHCRDSSK